MLATRGRAKWTAIAIGIAIGPVSPADSLSELLAQTPDGRGAPAVTETVFELPDGGQMRYAISLPDGYEGEPIPRPMILALHPGGRSTYYGSWFMQSVVEPALRDWQAVIVAPDVPARSWAEPASDRAVLALLDHVMTEHSIDRTRVLITGFSMGGRGTWYFATRHSELFTGAIPIAARRGDDPLEGLGSMPVHVIHSPQDELIPYEQAEETVRSLESLDHPVRLLRVNGAGHYIMGDYVGPLRAAGEWLLQQWDGDTRDDR